MRQTSILYSLQVLWVILLAIATQALAAAAETEEVEDGAPSSSSETALPTDEHGDYNGKDLIEWIRSDPQGDIHPSLRIGREIPGDPQSILGLYVKSDGEPIEKGDIIAEVPWSHMITPDGKYQKYKFFSCRAIYNIAKELNLGDKSKRAPYVRYLLSQPRGSMPGEWTKKGQDMLLTLLNMNELPPYMDTWMDHYQEEWVEGCSGDENDDTQARAYWLASSRDEDSLMVPIYDMANHSNDPDKLNTLSYKPNKAGHTFRFVASKKILPGEQIYNSYNRCNRCSDVPKKDCETFSFYRTPDIFVHFGFVEDYPQYWEFDRGNHDSEDSSDDDNEFEFCLRKNKETGELEAYFEEDEEPDYADKVYMKEQLNHLEEFMAKKSKAMYRALFLLEDGEENPDGEKMTQWEWESIQRYYDALVQALTVAIAEVDDDHDEL